MAADLTCFKQSATTAYFRTSDCRAICYDALVNRGKLVKPETLLPNSAVGSVDNQQFDVFQNRRSRLGGGKWSIKRCTPLPSDP